MLQLGHGIPPWITLLKAVAWYESTLLQLGHGIPPWITGGR